MDIEIVKANLERRGYSVQVFDTKEAAADYLNDAIDQTTVGCGGSVTIREMGLFDTLRAHNTVWWHNDPAQVEQYGAKAIRNAAMTTEVYLSSVNGMSEQGEIVNIDGAGNRVAACCYGHARLYYVVGENKIAVNLEQALWRARNIAAPKNAMRLNRKTPCAVKGDRCYDCQSPERICRGTLIQTQPMTGTKAEVILIKEPLGY